MAKAEMEKAIIDRIKALVEENNELDASRREMVREEVANGTNPEVFEDLFYFNGHIYMTELMNVISVVVFGHPAQERIDYDKKFRGVPRCNNYRNILTEDEESKLNKVIGGMAKANIIKVSKSGMMVKLVKEA